VLFGAHLTRDGPIGNMQKVRWCQRNEASAVGRYPRATRVEMNLCYRLLHVILATAAIAWSAVAECQDVRSQQPATQSPDAPNSTSDATARPPEPGEIFRDCSDCPEMVVVPAGEFKMGSGETVYERPEHRVVIARPFAIGRREITFEEWDLCVASGGCKYRPDDHGWGRGRRPVIDVSWDDAKAFVSWLSQTTQKRYRLPSEAEWEYAARAGTSSQFWWGRASVTDNANCEDCSRTAPRQTLPTGSFRPNGFGLFDVAGNVAEWVEDCWNESYRGAPMDGSAWTTGQCGLRGLRGGSFVSKANVIRSAARFRYDHDVRYYANGFRVVRDLR
jgi:formylglycine-generating enzyme required for sulfatase activity